MRRSAGGILELLTLAVSLSGINPTQIGIPPAPALASAERGGEAVEVYWQALLRDVPLTELRDDTTNRDVLAAVEEINKLQDFRGPKSGGRVTPGTLFRANALYFDAADPKGRSVTPPGVLDGPLVSQFLLRDVPYGAQWIGAQIRTALPASEFGFPRKAGHFIASMTYRHGRLPLAGPG